MLYTHQFLFIDLCLVADTACTNGLKFNVHRIWYHNYWYQLDVPQNERGPPNPVGSFLPYSKSIRSRKPLKISSCDFASPSNHPSWSSSATPGTTPTVPEAIIPDHLATPWLIVQRPTKWLPSMMKKESQWPLCSNPPKKSCFFCHFFVSFKNTSSSSFAHWPHTQPKTRPSTSHQQNFLERSPYIPENLPGWFTWKIPPKDRNPEKSSLRNQNPNLPIFGGLSNWRNFRCSSTVTPFLGDHPINGHRHPTLEAHWKAAGSFFTAAVTSKLSTNEIPHKYSETPRRNHISICCILLRTQPFS